MKKMFLMIFAIMAMFAGSVNAADQAADSAKDKEPQFFARVSAPFEKDELQISPDDYPNGVNVLVQVRRCLWCKIERMPKVEEIYAERLKAFGFKIVDREKADAMFRILTGGIDPSEIQDGKNNIMWRSLDIADQVIGIVAGAKISNGASIAVHGRYMMDLKLSKKDAHIGILIEDPKTEKRIKSGQVSVVAEYSEDSPTVSASLVALAMNEWCKAHIIQKPAAAPVVASSPAVAASAAQPAVRTTPAAQPPKNAISAPAASSVQSSVSLSTGGSAVAHQ